MKIICTLLAFLCPFLSLAQSNFKPGYVVNLKGDTVRGSIDYKDWSLNPKSISFKNEAGQPANYTATDIKAFGVDGFDFYRSYLVKISMDRITSNDLSSTLDTSTISNNAFMRIISTGKKVTLYSYNDQLRWRYFIGEADATPIELAYHIYINPKENNTAVNVDSYKRQLQQLVVKYIPKQTDLLTKIQRFNYRLSSFEQIVSKINGDEKIVKLKQKSDARTGLTFYLGAGLSSYTAKFLGDDYLSALPPSQSVSVKISSGVDVYFNKNVGRWLVKFDLSFVNGNYDFYYDGGKTDDFTQRMTFSQSTLLFNPQLLANVYNAQNFKVYISGGGSLGINFYGNKQNVFNNAGATVDGMYYFPSLSATTLGITGRVGVVINKFDFHIGYSPYTSITSTSSNKPIAASLGQVGINYLFK